MMMNSKKTRQSRNKSIETYGTEPVKLMPLKYGDLVMASPKTGPSAGIKFFNWETRV